EDEEGDTIRVTVTATNSEGAVAATSDATAEVVPSTAFITTWEIPNDGDSITLPLISAGSYDFTVDWGDGTSDHITAYDQAERVHQYATAGTKTVEITGTCDRWSFFNVPTSAALIRTVEDWGDVGFTTLENAFRASGLTTVKGKGT